MAGAERLGHILRSHSATPTPHLSKQVLKSGCPCDDPLDHLTRNFTAASTACPGRFPCKMPLAFLTPECALGSLNLNHKNEKSRTKVRLFSWLGRRDSNSRMPGPKPGALPLGDAPASNLHDSLTSFRTHIVNCKAAWCLGKLCLPTDLSCMQPVAS